MIEFLQFCWLLRDVIVLISSLQISYDGYISFGAIALMTFWLFSSILGLYPQLKRCPYYTTAVALSRNRLAHTDTQKNKVVIISWVQLGSCLLKHPFVFYFIGRKTVSTVLLLIQSIDNFGPRIEFFFGNTLCLINKLGIITQQWSYVNLILWEFYFFPAIQNMFPIALWNVL